MDQNNGNDGFFDASPLQAMRSPTPAAPAAAAQPSVFKNILNSVETLAANDGANVLGVVTMALLTAVVGGAVAVGIYFLMKKVAIKVETYLLPESKLPLVGTAYQKLMGGDIPRAYNGRRATLSFWIYVNDINKFSGVYRHVLHRGDQDLASASPLVFLDKSSNQLHVRFDGIQTPTTLTATQPFKRAVSVPYADTGTGAVVQKYLAGDIKLDEQALAYDLATHGITIDYIPLQRWVHVAVVVNEDVNAGIISAFLDGELVKSVQSNSPHTANLAIVGCVVAGKSDACASGVTPTEKSVSVTLPRLFQNLNLDKVGDIYVGGDPTSGAGPGFSGLVAGIRFANFDLNTQDIYKQYEEGPVDNLAAKMGLPAYGVRSPVYRLT